MSKLLQQAQLLEQYYTQLVQHEESLYRAIRETVAAIDAIRTLGEKPDSDTLLPVGMGAFVKARISASDKMILNVGAGAALEKDREYVLNYLEVRMKEIETSLQDTSAKRQKAEAQLDDTRQRVGRMIPQTPK